MVGAIEFLRKAKAICNKQLICTKKCTLYKECGEPYCESNEAELVRKVMEHEIKEESDGNDN